MKKFLIVLSAAVVCMSADAKDVNFLKDAKKALMYDEPDFQAARDYIQSALSDEATKNLAETWYVAGQIGHDEAEYLTQQASVGSIQYDQDYICSVVAESYRYWLVADSLALIPDEKGKVDNSIHRKITNGMVKYYKSQYLAGLAYALYSKEEYAQATQAYEQYLNMPNLPMFSNGKYSKDLVKDTLYYTFQRYAGLCAYEGKLYDKAIALLSAMNSPEVIAVAKQQDVIYANEFLYNAYLESKDTAKAIASLQENIKRFPQTPWFLQNLINAYISNGQMQEAIQYLDVAAKNDPSNATEYILLKGNMLANAKQYEEALLVYNELLSRDANVADAYAGKGRVHYNQAVDITESVAYLTDNKEYNAQMEKAMELFKSSLPFFEKAHELAPMNRDYLVILRQLYYRLDMEDKYMQVSEELKQLPQE